MVLKQPPKNPKKLAKKKAVSKAKSLEAYRSKLESKVANMLPEGCTYEKDKLHYVIPESKHKYTPDFCIGKNKFIEVKGYLKPVERKKHVLLKEQHPEVTIYFFFDNADKKIYKGSKTTYGMWARENGFEYSDMKRGLPPEWFD
jgi:hypothetical protein